MCMAKKNSVTKKACTFFTDNVIFSIVGIRRLVKLHLPNSFFTTRLLNDLDKYLHPDYKNDGYIFIKKKKKKQQRMHLQVYDPTKVEWLPFSFHFSPIIFFACTNEWVAFSLVWNQKSSINSFFDWKLLLDAITLSFSPTSLILWSIIIWKGSWFELEKKMCIFFDTRFFPIMNISLHWASIRNLSNTSST